MQRNYSEKRDYTVPRRYDCLARDYIAATASEQGLLAITRVLSDEEFSVELRKKLLEEVNEFIATGEIEELADILEVVYTLAHTMGSTVQNIERIRREKAEKRGSFHRKIFLKEEKKPIN